MTDSRFDACLPPILKEEGGNDDDPHDHGGRTSRGIVQREYTSYCLKHGIPDGDVWAAPNIVIRDIYYDDYWLPHGPKLHPGIDLVYFNFAVNAGGGEAHKLLMKSIGPDDVDNDVQTINRMCNEGEVFYRGLAQFARYGRDWTGRTERIRVLALGMQKEALMGPHDPLPPQKPKPAPADPSPFQVEKGHVVVDLTKLEADVNVGLDIAEKMMPWLSMLLGPQVTALIFAAIKGARTIEGVVNQGMPAAINATVAHLTPGAPNSDVLQP